MHKRKNSLIHAIINVNTDEIPSIMVAWFMRFFLFAGLIIGSTVITALFVARFGIDKLPLLFILNSLFVIIGTYYFSYLVRRFAITDLINFSILLSATMLAIASILHGSNDLLFFLAIITAQAVFIAQLEILIFAFIEEMFTPLAGERVFPIIESGELIGALTGAILVSVLVNYFPPDRILYFWMVALFLIACLIRIFPGKSDSLPRLYRNHSGQKEHRKNLSQATKYIRCFSFLKKLLCIVAFYWILHKLIVYQFTQYVAENTYLTLKVGQNYEAKLTQNIGQLEAIIHASAFLVQLFVASRVITKLGTIKSLVIRPILLIINGIMLIFMPRFTIAVIARNNLEIGNIIHLNAYHNSYYVIGHEMREQIREFFEGYIRPIGIIIGMGIILILEQFFLSATVATAINFFVLLFSIASFLFIANSQKSYTAHALRQLQADTSPEIKLNAIEILMQSGHSKASKSGLAKTLMTIVEDQHTNHGVRSAAIKALAALNPDIIIDQINHAIHSNDSGLRYSLLIALWQNAKYQKSLHPLLEKTLQPNDQKSLKQMLHTLLKVEVPDVEKYILPHLKSNDPEIRFLANCALALTKKNIPYNELANTFLADFTQTGITATQIIKELPEKAQQRLQKELKRLVSPNVQKTIDNSRAKFLEDVEPSDLLELRHAYAIAGEHGALSDIENLMNNKNQC